MRKLFALSLAVLLMARVLVVPAYAAAPYDADWVPPVPRFIVPTASGFTLNIDFSGSVENIPSGPANWIESLIADEKSVVVCLLDQGVYNRYNEENNIDYDRQFSIYLVSPDKKSNGTYYDLGVFEHNGGPRHQEQMNIPSPMMYMCLNNPHSFVKYIYDPDTDRLSIQPGVSKLPAGASLRFTYVLGAGRIWNYLPDTDNGPFSGSSDVYPGFTRVSGKEFGVGTVYHQVVGGKAVNHWRDYDWWLGIEGDPVPSYNPNLDLNQDTDGDGNPDINIDTDGDGNSDINIDTDGDGKPDINIDTDGDGKPDINIDTNGDGNPDINIDTNGDRNPDINVDTNGDGKPDINIDTDGDRKPDINVDTNGDRKPDINIDTNGDRKPDINIDTNGDGKPDTNIDIDGDGKPDVNVKPGDGSSSGGSSGGSSGSEGGSSGGGPDGPGSGGGISSGKGSGPPNTWFDDPEELPRDSWNFFDPFQFDYDPFPWNRDYDPLEGYDPGRMPDIPKAGTPGFSGYDPFDIPNGIKFKDFAGGGNK